jgi:YVTN family beta-propeller protein
VYVANGGSNPGTISVIATSDHTVVATADTGSGLYGIGVTPSGGHVYAASQDVGGVFVLDTATNTVSGPVAVSLGPTAFGLFITPQAGDGGGDGGGGDGGSGCDTAALEQALAAAHQEMASLQAGNQALTADNERLRSKVTRIQRTIASFVDRTLGDHTDGNVARAAWAVAQAELKAARAAAPRDWRVRLATRSFEDGESAMRRRDHERAVHEFLEVHELVKQLVGDRAGVPVTAPGKPRAVGIVNRPAGGDGSDSCDTAALEQSLAAAEQKIASSTADHQALTTENERLRSELAALRATLGSFVKRLFGHRTDGNVAAAARAAALAELTAAREAAPRDWRLRLAQHSFDQGDNALGRQDWGRAVHEFRETHEVAERILRDRRHGEHDHHHRDKEHDHDHDKKHDRAKR